MILMRELIVITLAMKKPQKKASLGLLFGSLKKNQEVTQ